MATRTTHYSTPYKRTACGLEVLLQSEPIDLTASWVWVDCLHCIAMDHPDPVRRQAAQRQVRPWLPDRRDPDDVETWLAG